MTIMLYTAKMKLSKTTQRLTVVSYVFTIKSNAILRWRSIYFSMETGQIYSVSHDCGSVPIDSVLKEVDTAKIHFYMLSGFVYTVKRGKLRMNFISSCPVVDIQGLELS
jgi:hypothetical protein